MTRPVDPTEPWAMRIGAGLALAAFVARLLMPTESTDLGDTLLLAVLSLVAAAVSLVGCWQAGRRLRADPFAFAVAAIVLGHVLSGAWILATGGQQRAALNVMWEWCGVGAVCLVLRQRRSTLHVLLAMTLMLAGHGIWQYAVAFPALRAEYAGDVAALQKGGLEEFASRKHLTERGIPEARGTRILFAQRLESLEPLGPFALTNTLAGFLAVGVLALAVALWMSQSRGQSLLLLLALLPVAWCLVLTKSRTAWLATVVTLGLVSLSRLLRGRTQLVPRRVVMGGLAVAGVMAVLVTAAAATGGLDRMVLSEAPKSLQYRIHYWQATLATLRESAWMGTGPGNFRQRYQAHQLPESSEQILDPHNLFLDAWASGGLLALAGTVVLAGLVLRRLLRGGCSFPFAGSSRGGVMAAVSGFVLVAAAQWLVGQESWLVPVQAVGFLAAAGLLVPGLRGVSLSAASAAAGTGLVIHLCGAGGIGMPAVSQTLLLLAAWSDERPLVRVPAGRVDRAGALLLAVVFTAAAALCMQTSVIPVQRAGLLMLQGDRAAAGATKIDFYQQAAAADRFSPEPWRKVARVWLSQRRWQSAIEALSKAAARDPLSFQDLRALGLAYQAWGTESQQAEHLARAVEFLEAAVERYPASSQLWAELALARFQAGQPEKARQAAERALQLDRINRECGHRDRYLDRDFTDQLKLILERTMSQ